MMIEVRKKMRRLAFEGKELLSYRISFPYFPDEDAREINRFYETAAKNCEAFCEGELFEKVQREYVESEDKNKRFHFAPYRYEADFSVHFADETVICVALEISLKRSGRTGECYRTRMAQNWQPGVWCLLSPEEVVRCRMGRNVPKKSRKQTEEVLIEGNRLMVLEGDRWIPFRLPEQSESKKRKKPEEAEQNL